MLNNPKLDRAMSDSRDISIAKIKTAFANTVSTLFKHGKRRSGCIQSTMRLQPVVVRRTLAHSVKRKARCRLRFYIGSCSCCCRSFTSIAVSLLRYLNIVCTMNLRPNPSFKRSANGRPRPARHRGLSCTARAWRPAVVARLTQTLGRRKGMFTSLLRFRQYRVPLAPASRRFGC